MNIFLRLEEAMIEFWQKLVFQQIKYSVFEKIILLKKLLYYRCRHSYLLLQVLNTPVGVWMLSSEGTSTLRGVHSPGASGRHQCCGALRNLCTGGTIAMCSSDAPR